MLPDKYLGGRKKHGTHAGPPSACQFSALLQPDCEIPGNDSFLRVQESLELIEPGNSLDRRQLIDVDRAEPLECGIGFLDEPQLGSGFAGLAALDVTRCFEFGEQRLRPVLLNSITTVIGLAPLLMNRSFQAQGIIPMAVSMAFGQMLSTTIVLLLMPTFYYTISRFANAISRLAHDSVIEPIDSEAKNPEVTSLTAAS